VIYRCRVCEYEEARGCLPTVTCGLYLVFLLGLSAACIAAAARGLRVLVGERPAPAEPVEAPWWVAVVVVVAGLVLVVVGVAAVKFVLELVEYLSFAWRRCPRCGARRWSWGFTRGFGL
jgi:hypothetical protein